MYFESIKRFKKSLVDVDEIYRISNFFKNNKAIITKMNHCMGDSGHNQYDAYMQLSDDGEFMKIVKKLPLQNMYVKSANQLFIAHEKARIKTERVKRNTEGIHKAPGVENEEHLQKLIKDEIISLKQS